LHKSQVTVASLKFMKYIKIFFILVLSAVFSFIIFCNVVNAQGTISQNSKEVLSPVSANDFYAFLLDREDAMSSKMLEYSNQSLQHSKDTINYFLVILGLVTAAIALFGWKTLRDVKKYAKNKAEEVANNEISKVTSDFQLQINKIDEKVEEGTQTSSLWRQLEGTDDLNVQLETIDKLIKEDSKDYILYGKKAMILREMKKYIEAIEYSNKAIEINPKDSIAHANKAFCLLRLNRNSEAIEELNIAIGINPKSVYFRQKARTLMEMKKYVEAIELFKKARNMEMADGDGTCDYIVYSVNISFCYHKLRDFQKAYETSRIGLHCGATIELLVNKGLAAAGLGNRDEAIELLNDAEEIGVRNNEVIYCKARAYSLLKDYNNALKFLNKAIQKDKKWADEAKQDTDFDFIKNTVEFKTLIGEEE
jgi:tetratricopeptide (TPR) repeat protein